MVSWQISVPLAHVFTLSIQQGKFPSALKFSRIVPIYKGGDKLSCDNYRPIALQSSIAKILEKAVSVQLTNHLERNNLITENQYGFQHGKSTEQNLLSVINYISSAMNDGDYCIGIFLDLKKAFDVCSHDILLKKMKHLGIKGNALKWFESYLSDRHQRVDINGVLSDLLSIDDLSIFQGSILGPILFLIYINDLPSATSLFSVLFADDTQALSRGKDLSKLVSDTNTKN